MPSLALAAVFISVLGYLAFDKWLAVRYPKAPRNDSDNGARLTALENRLTTIELQRGILRQVPNR